MPVVTVFEQHAQQYDDWFAGSMGTSRSIRLKSQRFGSSFPSLEWASK